MNPISYAKSFFGFKVFISSLDLIGGHFGNHPTVAFLAAYGHTLQKQSCNRHECRSRSIPQWVGTDFHLRQRPGRYLCLDNPDSSPLRWSLLLCPFTLWGCVALAKAKGYSTAILLTLILGWLFPVVVLLALPDKNKHRRRWRRAAPRDMSHPSPTSRS